MTDYQMTVTWKIDDVDISALTKKMNESLDKLDQAEVE